MNGIPVWVSWAAGIFFVVNILFYVALIVAVLRISSLLRDLRPKIDELSGRVHSLADRIEGVAQRVEEVAESVRDTISGVGGKAKGVVGSVELIAQSASRQFERFSPFVVGALTAIRLVKALNEMRKGRPLKDATKKGVVERTPARKRSTLLLDKLRRK